MIEQLVQQFMGSDMARQAVSQVQRQTNLDAGQAQAAVAATAVGAAEAANDDGLSGIIGALGGGGGLGALASAFGGAHGGRRDRSLRLTCVEVGLPLHLRHRLPRHVASHELLHQLLDHVPARVSARGYTISPLHRGEALARSSTKCMPGSRRPRAMSWTISVASAFTGVGTPWRRPRATTSPLRKSIAGGRPRSIAASIDDRMRR